MHKLLKAVYRFALKADNPYNEDIANLLNNNINIMYDLIVIGLGPAGMTAGIFAARREMKTLVIGKELGGQLVWASEIENYPGAPSISSFDLVEKMRKQTVEAGAEIKIDDVKRIEKQEDGSFLVHTSKDVHQTSAIIVCLGLSPRRLAIPGEVELSGKGVSYCANCDGPFYKNKKVAVVGGGNSALDAAEVLSKIASEVYLIHRNDHFRGFETLVSDVKKKDNVKILLESEVKEIKGSDKAESIMVESKNKEGLEEIHLDGVFVEIGRIASTDLIAEFVDRSENNQVFINEMGETRTPGLFAAGDVTTCEIKQITVAAGQATIASMTAYKYLQAKTGKKFIDRRY